MIRASDRPIARTSLTALPRRMVLGQTGSGRMPDASACYPFATPPDFGVAAYANNDEGMGITCNLGVRVFVNPQSGHWNSLAECPLCAKCWSDGSGKNEPEILPGRHLFWRKIGEGDRQLRVKLVMCLTCWRSLGDSNPCFRRERAQTRHWRTSATTIKPSKSAEIGRFPPCTFADILLRPFRIFSVRLVVRASWHARCAMQSSTLDLLARA
jgi:hypothetical protein